ncbi:hypothetical protein BGZ89_003786 [Linnemannia elongata]|nr:hypothetical protein BGZ89_003786 [Linnemannia elongata]
MAKSFENNYGQSQDDEGAMDNYFAVQGDEQAENNVILNGGKSSHIQRGYVDPNAATNSSYSIALSCSTDETQVFQRDGSPSEGVLNRRQQQQQQASVLGTFDSPMQ